MQDPYIGSESTRPSPAKQAQSRSEGFGLRATAAPHDEPLLERDSRSYTPTHKVRFVRRPKRGGSVTVHGLHTVAKGT